VVDGRSDAELEAAARVAHRLGLALSWTDGLEPESAKVCSRGGSAAWKNAKPLPNDELAALAFFTRRARSRNPVVVGSASRKILAEWDGGEIAELCALHRLPLPPASVGARSRRGPHRWFEPPAGWSGPWKIQVDRKTVTLSDDGYLVFVGALHPSGHVYGYESDDGAVAPAELSLRFLQATAELAGQADEQLAAALESGQPIPVGQRDAAVFRFALRLVRDGLGRGEVLERALELNRKQCSPPLEEKLVRKQVDGAFSWAPKHPTENDRAREQARRMREERRSGTTPRGAKRAGLFLPFVDVRLSGPPRYIWRRRIPERAVTLCAGRPKLGKSLFAIWLAAQLSRGLLEGSYAEAPARSLIVAAEDPPDPIVKGWLIAAAADQTLVGTLVQDRQDRQDRHKEELGGLGGLDGAGAYARRLTIPDEYELLEQIVVENEIALVVLDPINSFLSHKVDAHRDAEIRRVLDPLGAMAARRGFASLAVVHLNRRADSDVLNRITGSGGYGGSARSILTFGRHPDNDAQRVVAAEGNWQKESQSDLFELREVIVFPDADPEEQTQPPLVHVGGCELQSSDLIEPLDDDRTALEEAKDYLLGELAFGPVPVVDLHRGADANGLSWRTVERAKKLLGVEARRVSASGTPRGGGRWEWFLEANEEEQAE
jgi:AAA domain/Primase C terminal 1 (PriCT-1)